MLLKGNDDVFTIELPKCDIEFTRYLYIKEEVKLSLLVSILQKNDDAIFWAYELYYSGFKHELFNFIWKIYYDFFATLNPNFGAYLFKKHLTFVSCDKTISAIIQDFLIRPFNTDIFFLRILKPAIVYHTPNIKTKEDLYSNFKLWIVTYDYRSMSHFILNEKHTFSITDIYILVLDILKLKSVLRRLKDLDNSLQISINPNIILLSKIMSVLSNNKKGKNFYICVDAEEIKQYETIETSDKIKHYNILKRACRCSIDELKHLSLFKLKRKKHNITTMYLNNWEYQASFSPIWFDRYKQFGGFIDYKKQRLVFKDDDKMEQFYARYGYEPDEQPVSVQDKSIMKIECVINWKWFNNTYLFNGLFKITDNELEEFDVNGIEY
jgi:hypothetical protein